MTFYINREGDGYRETVSECDNREEAEFERSEYQFGDKNGSYFISRTPCDGWDEEEK